MNNCGPNGCTPSLASPVRARVLGFPNFDSFVNEFFGAQQPSAGWSTPTAASAMPMNISETDTHVVIRSLVPGISKDQIEIEIDDGVLTLTTNPVEEAAQNDAERVLRREFGTAKVQRRVRLNTPVLSQETQAELNDGVLTLRLAKMPDARPTKIRIG